MYPSTLDGIILRSPGGNLAISLGVDPVGRLSYSIAEGDIEVLDSSPLGLRVDGVDLGEGAKITGRAVVREIDEAYSIFGNHSQARNRAKEAVIPMKTSGKRFSLIVRAYDDGAAVRYILPEGARHIESDSTGWQLPEKTGRVVWSEYDPAYEGLSHATALAGIPQDRPVMAPITFEVEHHYLSISEADCESFSDMSIKRRGNLLQATFPLEPKGWDTQSTIVDARPNVLHGNYMGQLASPWRTTVVARDLTALVNSDLLTNLSPPPAQDMDFAWVKPGRALWSWWSVGNPPYDELETWYDAAAKLMWEYYLIDDGWIAWGRSGKDRWAMLKDISDYGKSVGVKTLVWGQYTEMPNPKARRAWLENAKAAGVEGVKLDFPPPASASCINWWYMGTLQDCAELRLLVNFHGSVKPTGMERTYPNSFTREAVRGDEYHMSRYKRIAPLEQDVTLPFARLLAGAGDITPVMMNPTELSTAGFTWPHEFAQAIVALSPVTAFADHYKYYLDSPLKDLFREIPTVWDETLVLSCTDIGQVVAYARRKDDSWWIGVMNGGKERNIEISLDFLDKPGHGTLVYDDASRDAAVERRERMVKSTDVLALKLRPAGGFVARITPQATRDSKPS
jgi:alpha-glucosidase